MSTTGFTQDYHHHIVFRMTGIWVAPVIDITLVGTRMRVGSCVWLKYIPVIVDVLSSMTGSD
jgi:hypothetical protein